MCPFERTVNCQIHRPILSISRLKMSSRKPTMVGLSIAMPVIATFAVALRVHARAIKKARLQLDDYLVFGALVRTAHQLLFLKHHKLISPVCAYLRFSATGCQQRPCQVRTSQCLSKAPVNDFEFRLIMLKWVSCLPGWSW